MDGGVIDVVPGAQVRAVGATGGRAGQVPVDVGRAGDLPGVDAGGVVERIVSGEVTWESLN